MNKNQINIIFAVAIGIILILGLLNFGIKADYQSKQSEFIAFEKSAKEIAKLKKMKKRVSSQLQDLKSIKAPTKEFAKPDSLVLNFENLNLADLNRLLKKIQGSYLQVRKLEIKNDSTNHATLILEIAK